MTFGKKAVALLAGGVATSAAITMTRKRFHQQLESDIEELFDRLPSGQLRLITEDNIANLPEPVQRWLYRAGVVNRARPRTVRLKQEGQFRLRPEQDWMPFTAQQYFTIERPGYVWSVNLRMFPLVSVAGRDRYLDGETSIRMRALSLVPLADTSGSEFNQAALLRYLGEMIWFPSAALEPYISWEEIDANSARATISDAGVSAPATFEFNESGMPVRLTAMRENEVTGTPEPWTATAWRTDIFQGITVPSEGEVTWNYESGDYTYIRWRITDLEYDRPLRY